MTKIGIGITSYNRPEHLRFCIEQIKKHTDKRDVKLFVYSQGHEDVKDGHTVDIEMESNPYMMSAKFTYASKPRGIAYAKNMCLYNLRDCDHIFLFDDDCFPKVDGWVDYFIKSRFNHSLYMNDRHIRDKINMIQDAGATKPRVVARSYVNSTGCFMYLTKEVIEKVGYFGSEHKGYGMEHAGYSQRIHRAGLTEQPFICLNETSQYIHSLDLDGPFEGFDVEHKPSLTYSEMSENMEHNRKVYELECTTGEIYKDFNP